MKRLLSLLLATTAYAASPVPKPTSPPVFDVTFQGAAIVARVTEPYGVTYQWYRGTASNPKKVKIPAPAGIQRELLFDPPYVAGLYYCEATNALGSTLSEPTQVSVTTSKTAPKMKLTLKQP